ncbi:hypothetical protein M1397_01750 [Candidatus Marsarchaeota archaeon]|nr:hypothetical protein [Candidatus Marsarchaeota archaeon]
MIGKESKRISNASLSEVLEILEKRKKEKELTYEQQIALEHATKFAAGKPLEQKVRKALEALGYLSPATVMTISNVMPKSEMLLKQILTGEKRTFTDEETKKIISIVNQK